MTFLDGFKQVLGNDSGPFVAAPTRLVLHTTEGSSADGAVGAFTSHNSWPHVTVDPVKKVRLQHVSLDRAARALLNVKGGVETNREGAIQIEMVGFAAHTQDWSDDALRWLATEVFAPILHATGITTDHPDFVGAEGHPAGHNAAQRFSAEEWEHFHGICGHQHVTENEHWDPGRFPIDRVLAFLDGAIPPPVRRAPSDEDDLTFITTPEQPPRVVVMAGGKLVHVARPGSIDTDGNTWDLSKDPATWNSLTKALGGVTG